MADFNEYKGVWVFCEQRQGALMPTDFELVSEARKLADELGCEVTGLLLGDNVEGIAKELGGYGADKVMVCDSPLLKDYTTDAYAKVVCDMVNEYKPEVLLIGATNIGRDLGPRCAARLHTGLTADATHLDIDTAKYIDFLKESSTIDLSKQKFDMEDRNLKMTRPAFGGHLMATIICPRFRPQMSTVRPGVMKKAPFDQAKADACQIVKPAFALAAEDIKTEVLSVEKAAEKLVDLIGADVIVSVGRGISKDVNKGIELAAGEYICFLDADDTWHPDYLQNIETIVQKYPQSDIFVTAYRVIYANGRCKESRRLPQTNGCLPSYWETLGKGYDFVWTSATTVRRTALLAACLLYTSPSPRDA